MSRRPSRTHFKPQLKKQRTRTLDQRLLVGVVHKTTTGWLLESVNRRDKGTFILYCKSREPLSEGDLVLAEMKPGRLRSSREAKLKERLGTLDDPHHVSIIAIAQHDLAHRFSKAVREEAQKCDRPNLDGNLDLTSLPLITIDGEDARDFDDAVFAEPTDQGHHLIVAIADVARYVRGGTLLDEEAFTRGNSTYFPDRVVPMLPEELSNDLCSLRPDENRCTLLVHLFISFEGDLLRWKFERGIMRSRARLTYTEVQRAIDGHQSPKTDPLLEPILRPLYQAYSSLKAGRVKRGTLDLDLPERKVILTKDGAVARIELRERLDSHRLIEEFMITANVAAAAQLEGKGGLGLYRVHDKPSEMKLEGLREFLKSLDVHLAPQKDLHPRLLSQILKLSEATEHKDRIHDMMLRSQAQAFYSKENIGHFGLALSHYAHFTSPIRRYADLIVHRGLIRACRLGDDGLSDQEISKLEKIAEHISVTERRSAAAERDALERYVTLFLVNSVGKIFDARISGVTRFGLFARLNETQADGLIPIESLGQERFIFDEKTQSLMGKVSRKEFYLADKVKVKLEDASRITGSIIFSLVQDGKPLKSAENKSVHEHRPHTKSSKIKRKHWRPRA